MARGKKNANKNKKNKNKQARVVQNVTIHAGSSSKGRGGRKSYRQRLVEEPGLLCRTYEASMLCPDLAGPIRIPRVGQSAKTILGCDKTKHTIAGSGTDLVQGVSFDSVFDTAQSPIKIWTATSTSTNFTRTTAGCGMQFPTAASTADANLVSGCLVITYMGTVTGCAGEFLLGTTNRSILTATTNYGTIQYLPGVVRLPMSALLKGPIRVSLRKSSGAADEFLDTTSAIPDCEVPWMCTFGLPAGQTLAVDIVRNWETRPTVTSSLVPYEANHPSFSVDVAAYQDASAEVSQKASTVSTGIEDPDMWNHVDQWARNNVPGILASAASSAYTLYGNMIYENVRSRMPMALGWAQDMLHALP